LTRSSNIKLVLASGSPRRAQILGEAGISLDVVPADIDEDAVFEAALNGELSGAVESLALAKANSIAKIHAGEYVLGADTIVVLDGEVLGKPGSLDEAISMLRRLNDRSHQVITGVAVVNPAGETHTKHVSTAVKFRRLDEDAIAEYVSSGSPFDKAGGYGIQDDSFSPVASYDDCYLNVVGLPMCATSELLEQSGFVLSGALSCDGHATDGSGRTGFEADEPGAL
jgi:MAF protein